MGCEKIAEMRLNWEEEKYIYKHKHELVLSPTHYIKIKIFFEPKNNYLLIHIGDKFYVDGIPGAGLIQEYALSVFYLNFSNHGLTLYHHRRHSHLRLDFPLDVMFLLCFSFSFSFCTS